MHKRCMHVYACTLQGKVVKFMHKKIVKFIQTCVYIYTLQGKVVKFIGTQLGKDKVETCRYMCVCICIQGVC